ncbi:hypothetical protein [Microbispora sp. GKU 823]|uniref:hypothetical protein n=1 Tax=Microbispora sp. GKU 823 TaxID=1652100 RepID=UPI0021186175|nr:hypothetical protein [Microbispora sp. GKU 823]
MTSTTPNVASSAIPVRRLPARRWAAPGRTADSAVQPIREAVVSGGPKRGPLGRAADVGGGLVVGSLSFPLPPR